MLIAANVLRPAPQKKYSYFNSIELYSIYEEQLISFNSLIYKNGIINFIRYTHYGIIQEFSLSTGKLFFNEWVDQNSSYLVDDWGWYSIGLLICHRLSQKKFPLRMFTIALLQVFFKITLKIIIISI